MNYDDVSIALDLYNNWELVLQLFEIHRDGKLFYDNQNRLFMNREYGGPRMLDGLDYDILAFIQKHSVDMSTITQEDFFNKYCILNG